MVYNPECVHILLSFELARFFAKGFFCMRIIYTKLCAKLFMSQQDCLACLLAYAYSCKIIY